MVESKLYRKRLIWFILSILIMILFIGGLKVIVDQVNLDPIVEYYNQTIKLSQLRSQQSEYHCTQKVGMDQTVLDSIQFFIATKPAIICFNTTQEVDHYLETIGTVTEQK